MQNLLIIAQKVDENDDLLGFFVGWIRELRKNFGNVKVISHKEKDEESKILRWLRLCFRIFVEVPKCDVVFVHMSPVFAVIAGPWAWIWGKPIYLWYLHRSTNWKLRLAEKFCKKILTASKQSLTLKSGKIVELGHGIDTGRFARNDEFRITNDELRILSVGRISTIKNFEILLKTDLLVTIVGQPVMPKDFAYFENLKKYSNADFVGFVPYTEMPKHYVNADIFVNCAPTGGLDKAVLEAMASGCIPMTSNMAFSEIFGEYAEVCIFLLDNDDLKNKIMNIIKMPENEKRKISEYFAKIAKNNFDLSVFIPKLVNELNS